MKIAIEVDMTLKTNIIFIGTYTIRFTIYLPYISSTFMIMLIILFEFIQNADGQPCLFIVILILSIIQMDVHDFPAHVYVKYHIYD